MINSPESLRDLQSWMQKALLFPQQVSEEQSDRFIAPSSRLSASQRLAIYQRSYQIRLLQCMQGQFPALCHALGADLFDDFAGQYLHAYPSVSHTLYELGRRFPSYLEETRPDREEAADKRESWIDFMVDLARFEWQLFTLFDAPGWEGKPFATIDTPDRDLRLQPGFALGDYRFSVAGYYHAVQRQENPQFPPLQRSPVALVRKDYLTHTFPLTVVQYAFLLALDRGADVGEAMAIAAKEAGQPLERVYQSWAKPGSTREQWIEAGFFIAGDRQVETEKSLS